MHSEDFFGPEPPPWADQSRDLDQELIDALLRGPVDGRRDLDVAIALAELVHDEFRAFGTSGGERLDNGQSRAVLRALQTVLKRVGGVEFNPPFRNFETFHEHWVRNGCSGSGGYQARRDLLSDLFNPLHERLRVIEDRGSTGPKVTSQALDTLTDPTAIRDHLDRIERNLDADPRAAVGSAKELVESTAKLVLTAQKIPYGKNDDLQKLAHAAQQALGLAPKQVDGEQEVAPGLRSLLGGLLSLARGLAELRNQVGTGHGREQVPQWVTPRHARMAVGAAHVWCQFVLETLEARQPQ